MPDPSAATREQLREARRKNALLREQIVSRGLERSQKLLESYANYDWISVYSDMLDRFKNQDLGDFAITNVADRRWGMNYPIFRTEAELAMLRMPSRILCATNNYAIGLLTGLTSYVIGAGYDYRCAAIAGMEDLCPKELIAACQAVNDDFDKINCWQGGIEPGMEEELFWRSCEDGEFFLRMFPQEDGRTLVRTVEPEQVTAPIVSPGGSKRYSPGEGYFGIITPEDDPQTKLGYYVFYGVDPAGGSVVHAKEMVHHRRNVKRSIKRGMPDFTFSSYDTLMLADKLRRALGLGASIQASIAWVRQHAVATKDTVASTLDALDSMDWATPGGAPPGQGGYQKFTPGQILDVDKGQEYVPPPGAANATAHLAILQMLAVCGGNRWNAPPWLASGDGQSANYATSLTEESPFVRTVTREQHGYKAAFLRPRWFALEHFVRTRGGLRVRVKAGESVEERCYQWEDIVRLIDIQVEAHSPEVRNKTEEAQANQIRLQGGWKSAQTIQAEEGLDSDREQTNILEWRETMGQQQGPQLPPAGGPSPFGGTGLEPRPTPESRHLRESVKDDSGHEHADDGKFTGNGGGGAKQGSLFGDDGDAPAKKTKPAKTAKTGDKPKHGERAAALHAKHQELKKAIAAMRKERSSTFKAVKRDAIAAKKEAVKSVGAAQKAIAELPQFNDFDGDADLPDDPTIEGMETRMDLTDENEGPEDWLRNMKDAEKIAKTIASGKLSNFKHVDDDEKSTKLTEEQTTKLRAGMKAVAEHCAAARKSLATYQKHKQELRAIKRGASMKIRESLARILESMARDTKPSPADPADTSSTAASGASASE